jgi:hypothetical protein
MRERLPGDYDLMKSFGDLFLTREAQRAANIARIGKATSGVLLLVQAEVIRSPRIAALTRATCQELMDLRRAIFPP